MFYYACYNIITINKIKIVKYDELKQLRRINMYKERTESWRITESSDLSLNFALFTGCLYGFIAHIDEMSNNRLWLPK